MTLRDDDAIDQVRHWVDAMVIGENLCPFARPARAGIRYATCALEHVLSAVLDEAVALDAQPTDAPATTLLVVPRGLEAFDTYLDTLAQVEGVLGAAGFDGVLQVASFHPDYVFADGPADDLAHWTNRAPFPVFHLLREADISHAVDSHPDPARIPLRNQAHMRRLGIEAIRALYRA